MSLNKNIGQYFVDAKNSIAVAIKIGSTENRVRNKFRPPKGPTAESDNARNGAWDERLTTCTSRTTWADMDHTFSVIVAT